MSQTEKQKTGAWGEERAVNFLLTKGYEIVERNYRVKLGEIDIVAWHTKPHYGRTLCFVEVKTRGVEEDGSAERATKTKKMPPLFSAARCYCLDKGINTDKTPIQFEQVSVYSVDHKNEPVFRHYVIIVE